MSEYPSVSGVTSRPSSEDAANQFKAHALLSRRELFEKQERYSKERQAKRRTAVSGDVDDTASSSLPASTYLGFGDSHKKSGVAPWLVSQVKNIFTGGNNVPQKHQRRPSGASAKSSGSGERENRRGSDIARRASDETGGDSDTTKPKERLWHRRLAASHGRIGSADSALPPRPPMEAVPAEPQGLESPEMYPGARRRGKRVISAAPPSHKFVMSPPELPGTIISPIEAKRVPKNIFKAHVPRDSEDAGDSPSDDNGDDADVDDNNDEDGDGGGSVLVKSESEEEESPPPMERVQTGRHHSHQQRAIEAKPAAAKQPLGRLSTVDEMSAESEEVDITAGNDQSHQTLRHRKRAHSNISSPSESVKSYHDDREVDVSSPEMLARPSGVPKPRRHGSGFQLEQQGEKASRHFKGGETTSSGSELTREYSRRSAGRKERELAETASMEWLPVHKKLRDMLEAQQKESAALRQRIESLQSTLETKTAALEASVNTARAQLPAWKEDLHGWALRFEDDAIARREAEIRQQEERLRTSILRKADKKGEEIRSKLNILSAQLLELENDSLKELAARLGSSLIAYIWNGILLLVGCLSVVLGPFLAVVMRVLSKVWAWIGNVTGSSNSSIGSVVSRGSVSRDAAMSDAAESNVGNESGGEGENGGSASGVEDVTEESERSAFYKAADSVPTDGSVLRRRRDLR